MTIRSFKFGYNLKIAFSDLLTKAVSYFLMIFNVASKASEKIQILWPIVVFNIINVMNSFSLLQLPTQYFRSNFSVFCDQARSFSIWMIRKKKENVAFFAACLHIFNVTFIRAVSPIVQFARCYKNFLFASRAWKQNAFKVSNSYFPFSIFACRAKLFSYFPLITAFSGTIVIFGTLKSARGFLEIACTNTAFQLMSFHGKKFTGYPIYFNV